MKIFDREWYYRKYMCVYAKFSSSPKVSELKLRHNIRLCYENTFHKSLHFCYPKTLNEKLIWLSWYWRNSLKSICADKYKVREILQSKGFGNLCTKLYGSYIRTEDIDYSILSKTY